MTHTKPHQKVKDESLNIVFHLFHVPHHSIEQETALFFALHA